MRITNVSIIPGFGIQVIVDVIRQKHRAERKTHLPGSLGFSRHKQVARKLLPPVIGEYKLSRVDEHQSDTLSQIQYSWIRL